MLNLFQMEASRSILQNSFFEIEKKRKKCKFDKLRFALEYGFNKTKFLGFCSKIFNAILFCAKLRQFRDQLAGNGLWLGIVRGKADRVRSAKIDEKRENKSSC